MKIILFAVVVSGTFLTACNGADDAYTPSVNSEVAPLIVPKDSPASAAKTQQAYPLAQPVVPQGTLPNATPSNVVATGMNPAHGQPGHRCDIAVGAPLNSLPQNQPATAQPITAQPSNQPITVAPTVQAAPKTKTAPGMNPPHGEAGHRCDIAVGAPLNSPAVQPQITPAKDSGS